MGKWKRAIWLLTLSCWAPLTLAEPAQVAPASAAQATIPENKKVSANPAKDYEEGLRLLALGEKNADLSVYMDAAEHFRLAADAGHAGAQARYGSTLERGQFHDEAIKYYRLSADQGHMDGQFGLGSVYLLGEGVTQDLAEARKWLSLAGEQGHKLAIRTMADAYIRRELTAGELAQLTPRQVQDYIRSGLNLDAAARQSPEALAWIQRAADNDYLPALDALAAAYRSGRLGLAADTQKADAIAAKADKIRGVTPTVVRKRSALYRFLRGDDSEKNTETPKTPPQ